MPLTHSSGPLAFPNRRHWRSWASPVVPRHCSAAGERLRRDSGYSFFREQSSVWSAYGVPAELVEFPVSSAALQRRGMNKSHVMCTPATANSADGVHRLRELYEAWKGEGGGPRRRVQTTPGDRRGGQLPKRSGSGNADSCCRIKVSAGSLAADVPFNQFAKIQFFLNWALDLHSTRV